MDGKTISKIVTEGIKGYFDEKEERERIKAEAKAKAEKRQRFWLNMQWGIFVVAILYLFWKLYLLAESV